MLYIKLAADNIKKNGRTYVPYMLTCIITVAMFYIIHSLSLNEGLLKLEHGYSLVPQFMGLGTIVTAIFAAIFLFYTNRFLIKRRKREFGLYNVLGMDKNHISKVAALETLYVALIGLLFGLCAGIALDKLMYLLIAKIISAEVPLGFYISWQSVLGTLLLFSIIFFLIMLNSVRQVYFTNPIELMRSGNKGEKEPKAKVLTAVMGLGCLIGGYAISITVTEVKHALNLFFAAVILVVIGTYMLFSSGSVCLLKALRKNKRFYYKTKHFISVSGMLYRMKQNAVGLANICILSTMVLVMISTTTCLVIGVEMTLSYQYASDISIHFYDCYSEDYKIEGLRIMEKIREMIAENTDTTELKSDYTYLSFPCSITENGEITLAEVFFDSPLRLTFILEADHNRFSGDNIDLNRNEIALITLNYEYGGKALSIFGKTYQVKTEKNFDAPNGITSASSCIVMVKDIETLTEINDGYGKMLGGEDYVYFDQIIEFDTTEPEMWSEQLEELDKYDYIHIQDKNVARVENMQSYGGLFFLGLFLGALFMMAAILIIYYKQISEGYEDKSRYEILQNVGMSKAEVKSSIHSQVLTVFFLPLMTAGIHVAFAFPIISRLMALLGYSSNLLYGACTGICFLAFAGLYVMIYFVTARAYYKIVST